MDNYAIADQLQLLSKLMDIHGENAFKAKSFASAAFTIEKLPQEISAMPEDKIFKIRGIGESIGNNILEILKYGQLPLLQEYISNTPEGVIEMQHIKGLGSKKIHTLWKELHIDSIAKLKEACEKGKLAETKGFGQKTEQKILEELKFQHQNSGKFLYAQVENFALALTAKLKEKFPEDEIEVTGEFRRQIEIIEKIEWVSTTPLNVLKALLLQGGFTFVSETEDVLMLSTDTSLSLQFHITSKANFFKTLFNTTGSAAFLEAWENSTKDFKKVELSSEEDIFVAASIPYIPPFLREKAQIITAASTNQWSNLIQTSEVKGLIHSHSNWSDGAYTIEQMALELKTLGFEYMVISDHSKAAFYANGLSEQRIREQHLYIDELNNKLAPFKIFKSIECDILNDGAMDYSNKVLATFDLVIASVHSNLQMEEEKAMTRLMGAITNPYVTIMGHLTGRRLLRRKGYPIDHKTIIDACAENNVAIEINASPERLDMDWRWIDYALEKNVLLSINPDAHSLDDFQNIKYGVLVAQKGGLTKEHNISSMSLAQFEDYLQKRRALKNIG